MVKIVSTEYLREHDYYTYLYAVDPNPSQERVKVDGVKKARKYKDKIRNRRKQKNKQ